MKVISIKRRAKVEREAGFEQLRAEGIRLAQSLSGKTWTDYNLHDPGVTILEQLCYALTDLVYRADFPVADHLCGPDGTIAFERFSLHPPHEIFPCRATTADDLRRVVLDRVPGLDDTTLAVPGGAAVPGVYRLRLQLSQDAGDSEAQRIGLALAACRAQRNLCEDVDADVVLVRDRWCELHAEIEVGGPRDAADVLAEAYDRCARAVARAVRFRGLDEALRDGHALEHIFDGPAMRHGFVADAAGADKLYVGDLAAEVLAIDGVKEVRHLALQPEGGAPTTVSLPRRGDGWALRLRVPGADGDARAGSVVVKRRGHVVPLNLAELRGKYDDMQTAAGARRARMDGEPAREAATRLPRGEARPPARYHSAQNHFPAVYGLGRHGVPASAGPQERAKALQLKAYLLLFEHVIANGAAQVQHLRELFSLNGGSPQSRWWQVLDGESVPGLDQVLDAPDELVQAVYAPFDRSPRRKGRVLDHLLALYGETYTQNSMRQFCTYHGPDELEALLLANKAAYLHDIVRLGRDRAGGFDYSQPAWDRGDNCSGLQRRVSLLLGFRHAHTRSLAHALDRQKLVLLSPQAHRAAGGAAALIDPARCRDAAAVARGADAVGHDEMLADLATIRPLRGRRISEAMFRAGVHGERYRVMETEGVHRLVLGPDEAGDWWQLGDFASDAAARRAAGSLRRFLLHLNEESEGLHVVEHVLLRPSGAEAAAADDFHAFRLTVVIPAWTVRSHQPAFRRFAEETVRINCPAHLAVRCLWLPQDAMREFEGRYREWLAAKQAWCGSAPDGEEVPRVDEAAAKLAECLVAGMWAEGGDA
ncbi:hypothetical protein [Piscinibacter sp.]|uniref:hypothetical protein n=1 Tax=Piscinibacter sp. TaxID=1903157 RepID=UPI002CC9C7AE|nr:hypothetical protein [Albitalea sp.]HUG26162.1 hypothetical protein [Albitalea sp.]